VNKKWVYPALLTFLVFFVLSSPETAGPQTRTFFSWVGDQASSLQTFLDGVFDDEPAAPGVVTTTTTVAANGAAGTDGFNTLGPVRSGGTATL
jgi:hypothetical protein